jgi:hypothetical protein
MLGWNSQHAPSLCSNLDDEGELIDHTLDNFEPSESRLAWDGRKGQWIPVVYSFSFPDLFDYVEGGRARKLAHFSFPPSKRHAVMLDQGSPKLRIVPKTTLQGRYPRLAVPPSPLVNKMASIRPVDDDGDEEDEDDDLEVQGWGAHDPFNLESRPVQPMSWLDDINIEDFLSSAIDYQSDCNALPVSDPLYGRTGGRRLFSPCTPSSPPPPLFTDPDFRISPPKFTPNPPQ